MAGAEETAQPLRPEVCGSHVGTMGGGTTQVGADTDGDQVLRSDGAIDILAVIGLLSRIFRFGIRQLVVSTLFTILFIITWR